MSDREYRGILERINRLLKHQECSEALLHFITHIEKSYEDDIKALHRDCEFPIIEGNKIPLHLGNYNDHFRSERLQSFFGYLSEYPDLADHFCDLLFLKYIPSSKSLRKAG